MISLARALIVVLFLCLAAAAPAAPAATQDDVLSYTDARVKTIQQLQQKLGISEQKVGERLGLASPGPDRAKRRMALLPSLPSGVRIARHARYLLEDVSDWAADHRAGLVGAVLLGPVALAGLVAWLVRLGWYGRTGAFVLGNFATTTLIGAVGAEILVLLYLGLGARLAFWQVADPVLLGVAPFLLLATAVPVRLLLPRDRDLAFWAKVRLSLVLPATVAALLVLPGFVERHRAYALVAVATMCGLAIVGLNLFIRIGARRMAL